MWFNRMKIEEESPEEYGYDRIKFNFTESSTTDKSMADVGIKLPEDLLLCYGDHLGNAALRDLIAKDYNLKGDNVVVTVGACMAVFAIYSTLLKPGDHVVVMFPNYPADVDITYSLGCKTDLYTIKAENGYKLDIDELAAMITEETKLVTITYPHNPTGSMISEEELRQVIKMCEEKGVRILVDETYGDLVLGERIARAASISPMAISVESISKAIGVPGIRTGWIVCQDKELIEKIVAAKEQICICGSVVDEECAYQVMLRKDEILAPIKADIAEKFAIVEAFMERQKVFNWVKPAGGVVCFPCIKPEIEIDTAEFYDVLNNKYGVFVGPGHWFSMDDRYFRLGYAWPSKEKLIEGLEYLEKAVEDTRKN